MRIWWFICWLPSLLKYVSVYSCVTVYDHVCMIQFTLFTLWLASYELYSLGTVLILSYAVWKLPFWLYNSTYTGSEFFSVTIYGMRLKTPSIWRNIYIFSIDQLKEVIRCTCINIILICSKDACSWCLIGDFKVFS